jgi:hypothetical protein
MKTVVFIYYLASILNTLNKDLQNKNLDNKQYDEITQVIMYTSETLIPK